MGLQRNFSERLRRLGRPPVSAPHPLHAPRPHGGIPGGGQACSHT